MLNNQNWPMNPGFLVKHQFDLQVVITLFFLEKMAGGKYWEKIVGGKYYIFWGPFRLACLPPIK
jgi:hypothetical protein